MAAWAEAVEKGIINCSDMVYGFVFSEESQTKISNYSNEEFVTFLYKVLFNRTPDEEGFQGWISALEDGLSKEEVVRRFANSEEFIAICSYFGLAAN